MTIAKLFFYWDTQLLLAKPLGAQNIINNSTPNAYPVTNHWRLKSRYPKGLSIPCGKKFKELFLLFV